MEATTKAQTDCVDDQVGEDKVVDTETLDFDKRQVWVVDKYDLMVAAWEIMKHMGDGYDTEDNSDIELQELMARVFSVEHCFGTLGTYGDVTHRRANAEEFLRVVPAPDPEDVAKRRELQARDRASLRDSLQRDMHLLQFIRGKNRERLAGLLS